MVLPSPQMFPQPMADILRHWRVRRGPPVLLAWGEWSAVDMASPLSLSRLTVLCVLVAAPCIPSVLL